MALLDNVAKGIKNLTDTTKDALATQGLRGEIASHTEQLNQLYRNLGEKFFLSEHSATIKEFDGFCQAIKHEKSTIESIEKKIEELKTASICPNCNAPVDKNSAFCTSCGANLSQLKAAMATSAVICSKCGHSNKEGAKFCTGCGSAII